MRRSASPIPSLGLVAAFFVSIFAARCAKSQCNLNSDCGYRRFCDLDNVCRQDCAEDRDCPAGYCDPNGRCVEGPPPDAAPDVVVDATPDVTEDVAPDLPPVDRPVPVDMVVPIDNPPVDVFVPPDLPPPVDNPPPVDIFVPPDLPPPPDTSRPLAVYLDPCSSNADCQSGDCATAGVASGFCTRTCASRRDCGNGYLCAIPAGGSSGRCLPDDTGLRCDPRAASSPCARFCFGNSASGVGHCTRECANGADCPAGFACSVVSGTSVCVEVERSCVRAADCPSNFCLGPSATFAGCSAQCRTSADCPRRFTLNDSGRLIALPPYQCMSGLCVPPLQGVISGGDIQGTDPIGSSCGASGTVSCYSGVCDTGTPGDPLAPAMCVQTCTPAGGCPNGYGCKPWLPDGPGGDLYLTCRPAGSGAVGTTCTRGGDCATALCQGVTATTGYCTRLCADGLCPTGMRCTLAGTTIDGTSISLCLRP